MQPKKKKSMIKCNVTVCGIVAKSAAMRTNKEGTAFLAVPVTVAVPAKSGSGKTIEISVRKDGSEAEVTDYRVGTRIEVTGTLTLKKRGERLYFNLSASTVNFSPETNEDALTGEMEFRGKVGKNIEECTDKKGNPYIQFSAHSTEKVDETFESIWVRFFRFDAVREEWLQPGCRVQVKGGLNISVYEDRLNLACKVEEMSEAIKPEYNTND